MDWGKEGRCFFALRGLDGVDSGRLIVGPVAAVDLLERKFVIQGLRPTSSYKEHWHIKIEDFAARTYDDSVDQVSVQYAE